MEISIVPDGKQGKAWQGQEGSTGLGPTSESKIFTVDVSREPALVTDELTITGGTGNYDPEGIAVAPDDTYLGG